MPAAIVALLPELIKLIPIISTGVGNLIAFIADIRKAAQQSGEWAPQMEKAFIDSLIAKASTDAWKTDAEVSSQ